MNFHKFADVVKDFLRIPPAPSPAATIAMALVEKIQGRIGAYVNAAGQLVCQYGLALASPLVGLGYSTGAGGAVTQITSSSTGVTLDKVTGQITTVALTTAAAAEEVFTVTNSTIAATDIPVVSTTYAGGGTVQVTTKKVVAGAFDIVIANLHTSAALDAAVVINFAVIKGVAA